MIAESAADSYWPHAALIAAAPKARVRCGLGAAARWPDVAGARITPAKPRASANDPSTMTDSE